MIYDVIIIGGGPAGMMAAIWAGRNGRKVLVLEKNKTLGMKLLITGKGRCNITNAQEDKKKLIATYGANGKFLFSSIFAFDNYQVIDFFNQLGLRTKVERGQRVFPISDDAASVLNALQKGLDASNVQIKYSCEVENIRKIKDDFIVQCKGNKSSVIAPKVIIACGGKSYPNSGSNGQGYLLASKLGHTIINPRPALTPIITKEKWVKSLQGLDLKNVELNLYQNNKKIASRFGEMLFTHFGISGPIVLDISKQVDEVINKNITLSINLKPALSVEELDKRLQRDFQELNNKQFKNALDKLLPKKLIPVIIQLSEIDPEIKVNKISRAQRLRLVKNLQNLELAPVKLKGYELAIVTAGGVDLKEINPKTMESKKTKGLYFCGEIIDIDGPTGGYNLQVAWSTGFVAGNEV